MTTSHEEVLGRHPEELREYRRWFVALGILLIILGVIAMVAAFAATMVTVLFFGILLLIAGVVQIVHALSAMRWQGFLLHLLGGLLYTTVGLVILVDPVSGAIGLTMVLAFFFIVGGIFKIALGIQAESGWFAFSGGLDLLLGMLIWLGWPETGTWVIGLFLGIELLFAGISLMLMASRLRAVRRTAGVSPPVDPGERRA
jgi:uncharacterized membrane protein HdeD (DUF308 family)